MIKKRRDLLVIVAGGIVLLGAGLYFLPPIGKAVAVGTLVVIFGLF